MHGNVWEWCLDWYIEDYASLGSDDPVNVTKAEYRLLRGGSWDNIARYARSALRDWGAPGSRDDGGGFRVARTP